MADNRYRAVAHTYRVSPDWTEVFVKAKLTEFSSISSFTWTAQVVILSIAESCVAPSLEGFPMGSTSHLRPSLNHLLVSIKR